MKKASVFVWTSGIILTLFLAVSDPRHIYAQSPKLLPLPPPLPDSGKIEVVTKEKHLPLPPNPPTIEPISCHWDRVLAGLEERLPQVESEVREFHNAMEERLGRLRAWADRAHGGRSYFQELERVGGRMCTYRSLLPAHDIWNLPTLDLKNKDQLSRFMACNLNTEAYKRYQENVPYYHIASQHFGVPMAFLACKEYTETEFRPRTSSAGARGAMQIMPATLKDINGRWIQGRAEIFQSLKNPWQEYVNHPWPRQLNRRALNANSLETKADGSQIGETTYNDPAWSIGVGALYTRHLIQAFDVYSVAIRQIIREKEADPRYRHCELTPLKFEELLLVVSSAYNSGPNGFAKTLVRQARGIEGLMKVLADTGGRNASQNCLHIYSMYSCMNPGSTWSPRKPDPRHDWCDKSPPDDLVERACPDRPS